MLVNSACHNCRMSEPSSSPRVALITGGVKRVGRSVALHFARLGWDLAVTYHTSGEARSTLADEIERMGRQLLAVRADFADSDAAAEKIGHAVAARFNRLDLLVHNASLYEPCDLEHVTIDLLRRYMAIHVETPLLLTRRLRPLLETAEGTVIAMTDADLDRSRPSFLPYQLSKAALANLTKNLARELAPKVRANAIAPGAILWAEGMSDDQKAAYLARVPLDRAAETNEVPELIEFLATRGEYLTGQTFRMDGGRSLR